MKGCCLLLGNSRCWPYGMPGLVLETEEFGKWPLVPFIPVSLETGHRTADDVREGLHWGAVQALFSMLR